MKKTIKTLFLIALSMLMCLTSISAYAAEAENQVIPRLSHMDGASFVFDATSAGGIIEATYTGYEPSFVSAKLTVKVEKRFLLVFWDKVGTWTTTSTELDGFFSCLMSLEGPGTYRATFTLEVTGKDGTVDVITDTLESDY